MNENKKIIFCLGIMHNAIRKIADAKFMEIHHELSGMYVLILLYLEQQEQEHKKVFQKDLEQEFQISKATVSRILSRMEKKNLVRRKGNVGDARFKWIIMTEYARKMLPDLKKVEEQLECTILDGFSQGDKGILLNYIAKMEHNLWKSNK